MSEPFDPEFGPGVRTVRHNPTVVPPVVTAVRERLAEIASMKGELAATPYALATAAEVLCRLVTAHEDLRSRWDICPMPVGGVLADWMISHIGLTLRFPAATAPLRASLAHEYSSRSTEREFDAVAIAADPEPFVRWVCETVHAITRDPGPMPGFDEPEETP